MREVFDSVAFSVSRAESPAAAVGAIAAAGEAVGKRGRAYVRLASDNPSIAMADERESAWRVAETVMAAIVFQDATVTLDTFDRWTGLGA